MRQLDRGEHLFGLYDRGLGLFKLCPLLDEASEFDDFEAQYKAG